MPHGFVHVRSQRSRDRLLPLVPGGLWLDRGELDKIIERTSIAMAQEPERPRSPDRQAGPGGLMGMAASMLQGDDDRYDKHRGDRYDDRYDNRRPKKKKSLLSEFFD